MSVKQMPSGKWYAYLRYKDVFKQVHQKKKTGFKTKKEAQAWEREYRAIHEGKAAPNMTFDNLATRYFADMMPHWKQTTQHYVKNLYNARIKPYIGDLLLDDIDPNTIHNVHNKWQKAGISAYSQLTINRWMSSMFNFGVMYFGLLRNPVPLARLNLTYPRRQYNIWTKQDFTRFLKRIPDEQDGYTDYPVKMYKMFYELLFYTGCRKGEALALTVKDCDFTRHTISITKTRDKYGTDTPKTPYSMRTITMPAFLSKDLQDHVKTLYKPQDKTLLFPFASKSPYYYWHKWQEKYGQDLPYMRIHDLRHSHASLLIKLGFSPQVIADRLGHKNAAMVLKVYGHMYQDQRQEVADRLDALNDGKGRLIMGEIEEYNKKNDGEESEED